ncbi:ABC transporter substrate-binding protein [Streptomyces sp. NPDC049040]|uniref:ABC transporter substrate-binding protein n=1 Tax=Streptomyces sp. NPDC049040 TaxID=3365593 RepID=UPI003723D0B8
MRKFRSRTLALALTAVALLAAGCGSGPAKSNSLKLYNDKAAWTPYYKQVSAQAKQEAGVTVNPVGYADEPTYQAFVKSALKTRVKPDLFTWATGPLLSQLVESGDVGDTSALWSKAIRQGDLPQQLEQYYTVGGKQYCVPENVSYWVMFYNKSVFAENGITVPTSWSGLMDAAAKLKQSGRTPFYQTNVLFSFVWFQILLAGNDPDLYDKLVQGKASYTDPGVVDAMKQWRDMIGKGYMSDAGDKTDPATLLKSGKVAMVPDGTWFNTSMTQAGEKPGKDYGMFVIPKVNPSLAKTPVPVETGALCTAGKSSNSAAIDKFTTWWTTPAAQTRWSTSRGDVSANPKVTIPDPGLNTLTKQVTGTDYQLVDRYFDAVSPAVLTAALDGFGAFMADPDSYQKQLTAMQKVAASGS